jgi:MFS family permease
MGKDKWGYKLVPCTGSILMSLGIILASFSQSVLPTPPYPLPSQHSTSNHQLLHLYLTQSLLYGLGASALYFPIITLTPLHFSTHRGLALGIIMSGAGFGGLVLAPIIRTLISRLGLRWTLRALGMGNFLVTFWIGFVIRSDRERMGTGRGRGNRGLVNLRVARRKVFVFEGGNPLHLSSSLPYFSPFHVTFSPVLQSFPAFCTKSFWSDSLLPMLISFK